MNVVTYDQAVNPRFDAGYFRQYMATTYGEDLERGMSDEKYAKAIKDAKLLLSQMGEEANHTSITKVFDTAVEDYNNWLDLAATRLSEIFNG